MPRRTWSDARGRDGRGSGRTWPPPTRSCSACARSARPSSRRCPRSPPGPARSISGRASRTPTGLRRCSTRPRRRIAAGRNQYPPGPGIPELREAVSAHQQRFWGLDYDPDGEVLITAGATEAIAAAILALCEPGDEVVCFEPYYDSYAASIALAQARPAAGDPARRTGPGGTGSTPTELRRAFSPRTRLVLLNSPHNPTGKVFTRAELDLVAELCREYDVLAVTDEVYEHLRLHRRRRRRTFRSPPSRACGSAPCGSPRPARRSPARAGRSAGPAGPGALVSAVLRVKQFLTFVNGGTAAAGGRGRAGPAGRVLRRRSAADLQARRDLLARRPGRGRIPGAAGRRARTSSPTDITAAGRAATGSSSAGPCPSAAAWSPSRPRSSTTHVEAGRHLVRFAFCKRREVLADAVSRLAAHR